MTPNETSVLSVLRQSTKPQSAYDILDRLHGTKIRAAVQVYRALEKLTGQGVVHRLEAPGVGLRDRRLRDLVGEHDGQGD